MQLRIAECDAIEFLVTQAEVANNNNDNNDKFIDRPMQFSSPLERSSSSLLRICNQARLFQCAPKESCASFVFDCHWKIVTRQ